MIDLVAHISQRDPLKRVASTNGGEWAGACPLCGGQDRFRVWPNEENGRFWCRQCGFAGDLIDYARQVEGHTWSEASRLAGHTGRPVGQLDRSKRLWSEEVKRVAATSASTCPPSAQWQTRAKRFVGESYAALWTPKGRTVREWLNSRGLSEETLRGARIGFNTDGIREKREEWDLPPTDGVRQKQACMFLRAGVVIPCMLEDAIWNVRIRCLPGDPTERGSKYVQLAGGTNTLYGGDRIVPGAPVVMVEGEFDALSILQCAGDVIVPVSTCGATKARRTRWLARLATSCNVLVSFDTDDAGEAASDYWMKELHGAKRWAPLRHDVNEMLTSGVDVRAWVLEGLGRSTPEPSSPSPACYVWEPGDKLLDAIWSTEPRPEPHNSEPDVATARVTAAYEQSRGEWQRAYDTRDECELRKLVSQYAKTAGVEVQLPQVDNPVGTQNGEPTNV
jgi:DNA primase